ncbi:cysteine protease [Solirubrobacter sp. CPCC 204708]|uniref:Cysteine protease n=1 Tax=Solirubrobacter deserti TaxID=2282478 RepID=A0ABT4RVE2_9ACTN|nr:C1 family peptidase [Solirubrobacter deserti]MBE2315934.1 cysteine protease [Solirubrobacter deserti]MDA0142318.1 cysteine protease [Solirubrobacter deserti]
MTDAEIEFEAEFHGASEPHGFALSLPGVPGRKGLGWLRDHPSPRDYTVEHEKVAPLLARTAVPEGVAPPAKVDLREWCSGVEDQGEIGSCTAHAGVGMIEYYQRKAYGRHINASRSFLYKTTRKLGGFTGDSGAFLRTTMGAMALFGVVPEKYWPYRIEAFDKEPTAFCYAFAQSFQSIVYYRLDPPDATRADVLGAIKSHLASQMPAMFGFSVFESIHDGNTGEIPYPTDREELVGGHAVMAVGYDDEKRVKRRGSAKETKGAFLIRNSWGTSWGEKGYGWLPYAYVREHLADDWWVLQQQEWVDTGQFRT